MTALTAGGSTAMESGLDLAYAQAMLGFQPGGIARVIVLSDGDANVGNTTVDDMLKTIASRARQGVTLSTIGFGMGNYKDETMEQLANKGNGNNFYIDSLAAAKKVFAQQLGSTLEVVAKDAKFQVDFDPAFVARYRLVGYENRDIADTDFRNDKVDAGEINSGHQITALYEIVRTGVARTITFALATPSARSAALPAARRAAAALTTTTPETGTTTRSRQGHQSPPLLPLPLCFRSAPAGITPPPCTKHVLTWS